jgi:hypothetical protein
MGNIDDEKSKHIENINNSIDWLIKNSLWDEIEVIMKSCVIKVSVNMIKDVKNLPDDWYDIIKESLKERE